MARCNYCRDYDEQNHKVIASTTNSFKWSKFSTPVYLETELTIFQVDEGRKNNEEPVIMATFSIGGDEFARIFAPVNYCPICGRKLKEDK